MASGKCTICGKALSSNKERNVLVTGMGKPLFGVHKGKCFDAYERTRDAGASLVNDLAKLRAPKLHKGLRMLRAALSVEDD